MRLHAEGGWPAGTAPVNGLVCVGADVVHQADPGRAILVVHVETPAPRKPGACPGCGSPTGLIAYGRYTVKAWDVPTEGMPTRLFVRRRRFRCRACLRHPSEPLAWLHPGHELTQRLYAQIASAPPSASTRALSRQFMLAEGTIRAIRGGADSRAASMPAA